MIFVDSFVEKRPCGKPTLRKGAISGRGISETNPSNCKSEAAGTDNRQPLGQTVHARFNKSAPQSETQTRAAIKVAFCIATAFMGLSSVAAQRAAAPHPNESVEVIGRRWLQKARIMKNDRQGMLATCVFSKQEIINSNAQETKCV